MDVAISPAGAHPLRSPDKGASSDAARTVLQSWLARVPRLPEFAALRRAWAASPERSFLRLPAREGFEAWLVGWPPGTCAPLHDHGESYGAAGVLSGCLHEALCSAGAWRERRWQPGAAIALPRGICHEVRNQGAALALSVHVYAPRLERMTFYDRTARGDLRPVREELASQW